MMMATTVKGLMARQARMMMTRRLAVAARGAMTHWPARLRARFVAALRPPASEPKRKHRRRRSLLRTLPMQAQVRTRQLRRSAHDRTRCGRACWAQTPSEALRSCDQGVCGSLQLASLAATSAGSVGFHSAGFPTVAEPRQNDASADAPAAAAVLTTLILADGIMMIAQ